MGTGNYNPSTARSYTDYSLFTAKAAFTSDLANLFNTLTGYTRKPSFRKILVAPYTLHDEVIRMIREETKAAKSGKEARILIKVNSLVDPQCINELYLASQAGVKIDLIVRGICGLIPGVKGMSENVRVISLLGRFLEHSRVFHFHNSPPGKRTFLGSPDWMPRNFFRRIEVAFPIEDFNEEAKIMESMDSFIQDNEFSTHLRSKGQYVQPPKRRRPFSVQEHFIALSREETERKRKAELGSSAGKTENQGKGN